jgi:hypothetical protein
MCGSGRDPEEEGGTEEAGNTTTRDGQLLCEFGVYESWGCAPLLGSGGTDIAAVPTRRTDVVWAGGFAGASVDVTGVQTDCDP